MNRALLHRTFCTSSTRASALILLAGLSTACGGDEDNRSDAQKAYDDCIDMAGDNALAAAQCQSIVATADDQQGGLVGENDEAAGGSDGPDLAAGEFEACATGGAAASVKPVSMLLVVDRSSSMNDNDKWNQASAALVSFLQSPDTSGIGIALRFYPDDNGPGLCNQEDCNVDACSQPLVDSGLLTSDGAPGDAQEERLVSAVQSTDAWQDAGRGTPTHAALDGGLVWARAYQSAHPEEQAVVVLVTDGEPNGCNDNNTAIAGLASAAYEEAGILTYAIGLEGSMEPQIDEIAQAGHTNAVFIGSSDNAEQDFLDALNAIRGESLDCEFGVPEPAEGELDPNKVNVVLTSNGTDVQFDKVTGLDQCGDAMSWYYQGDDRIVLCPTACDTTLADPNAEIGLVFGCTTGEPVISVGGAR